MAASKSPSLFDAPREGTNTPEFSVGEISNLVKKTVEQTFGSVRVRGEISDCKLHTNGHLYLTLKEGPAILAAVCWRGQVGRLGLKPAIGMEVVCTGRLTTYAGQSKYQMVIEGMALAGIGALLKMLEERKKKLAAEGLFDPARKRPLPYLPRLIGVVTSPTGAVIRDILHRLSERFPRPVLLWPVAVQGEGAAEQIAAAVEGFNALSPNGAVPRPDILIVARGGGSVEDLMPFNEECVVRAVANSKIPVISAVGHETDTTLIDYASDLRAPTPTAAAEKAVPVRAELLSQIVDNGTRLYQAATRLLQDKAELLRLTERALGDPARAIEPLAQRLDEKSERLEIARRGFFERAQAKLNEAAGKLRHPRDILNLAVRMLDEKSQRLEIARRGVFERAQAKLNEAAGKLRHPRDLLNLSAERLANAGQKMSYAWKDLYTSKLNRLENKSAGLEFLSPRAVLGRGYALVQDVHGHVIASAKQAKRGDKLRIELQDGKIEAVTE
ncbi:MAG: exodeoxyribonuclease VII large subunit [Alphaproteobacteria bacterium]|nr:exodeoxyribonuclease VII large subunit [Alphaproteobacteria bacterium]